MPEGCCYPECYPGEEVLGAAREIRTPDPLITNEVLYQLSYCGAHPAIVAHGTRMLITDRASVASESGGALEARTLGSPARRCVDRRELDDGL